jgi:chemotaxis protein methyltransferase CheR
VTRSLSAEDFAAVRDYLRQTAGLEFDEGRKSGLSAVVHDRLVASGHSRVDQYLALVDGPDGAAERQRLLDAVTIRETHFHRSKPQIEALRTTILPEVLSRAARAGRGVTIWSAGCATGEEPYTLAMLMLEVAAGLSGLGRKRPAPMRVVGTDVSSTALQIARAGTYWGRTVALADPVAVRTWFRKDRDGSYTVRDEVRSMVDFAHHNLVTGSAPFGPATVDLVVCRHVTIYFGRDTTRALIHRFHDVLHPGGWLLLGPAESLFQVTDEFALEPVGDAFAYRSIGEAPGAASRRLALGPRPRSSTRNSSPVVAGSRTAGSSAQPVPARAGRGVPAPRTPAEHEAAGPELGTAVIAFETGDYAEAERVAQAVLASAPVDADAYVLLGHSRLNRGDAGGAVEALQRAVFLDPQAGHAYFLLAVALSSAGRPAQAAAAYRAAATTLGSVPAVAVSRMVEGRAPEELVQLCARLADEADSDADVLRRGA